MENYLSVFPDKEEDLLWNSEPIPFFMSPAFVKPRSDRYTLAPGSTKDLRSYNAISSMNDSRSIAFWFRFTPRQKPAGTCGLRIAWSTSRLGKL